MTSDVLELSDERDQWLERLLAAERRGYDAGRTDGIEEGRRAVLEEEASFRRATAMLVTGARRGMRYRSADELDRRRYPPNGRLAWLLPDGGDE